MNEKTEWLLLGWVGGLGCIIWGLLNWYKNGFGITPIVLFLLGVAIIVFTMVVIENNDW